MSFQRILIGIIFTIILIISLSFQEARQEITFQGKINGKVIWTAIKAAFSNTYESSGVVMAKIFGESVPDLWKYVVKVILSFLLYVSIITLIIGIYDTVTNNKTSSLLIFGIALLVIIILGFIYYGFGDLLQSNTIGANAPANAVNNFINDTPIENINADVNI